MSNRFQSALRRFAVAGLTAIAALQLCQPAAANAAAERHPRATVQAAARSAAAQTAYAARMRSYHIVAIARAQAGKPYRYGAVGPSAFDCSGLTGYAYRAVHLTLPRTADQQYRASRHLSRAAARPGDLVFWVSGGHAYHVAVYAGGGKVWHAPKPGSSVRLATIWSAGQVRFGRIGR
jgi:cell wall-associated NlpC family hydrolase